MYRKLILVAAALGVTGVAWADYEEIRELSLDTRGIDTLET